MGYKRDSRRPQSPRASALSEEIRGGGHAADHKGLEPRLRQLPLGTSLCICKKEGPLHKLLLGVLRSFKENLTSSPEPGGRKGWCRGVLLFVTSSGPAGRAKSWDIEMQGLPLPTARGGWQWPLTWGPSEGRWLQGGGREETHRNGPAWQALGDQRVTSQQVGPVQTRTLGRCPQQDRASLFMQEEKTQVCEDEIRRT